MRLLTRLLEPKAVAHAHCDLPCGVYDPAQARIEAESVKAIAEKYAQNTDPEVRARAIFIKEQRSELVQSLHGSPTGLVVVGACVPASLASLDVDGMDVPVLARPERVLEAVVSSRAEVM